jgi:ATP-dependent protease Clp ATPase subunit
MTRCGFCGKSPDDVRVIFVRDASAICDECVMLAFDAIGAEKGRVYKRVAYSVFRVVATLGRFLTLGAPRLLRSNRPS